MAEHYIDNKTFYEAIKQHRSNIKQAEADGKPKPIIPNYIGSCILLIANRLATKPNFINYSYKDEMISDGFENNGGNNDRANEERGLMVSGLYVVVQDVMRRFVFLTVSLTCSMRSCTSCSSDHSAQCGHTLYFLFPSSSFFPSLVTER